MIRVVDSHLAPEHGECVVCGIRRGPHQEWCADIAALNRLAAGEDESERHG